MATLGNNVLLPNTSNDTFNDQDINDIEEILLYKDKCTPYVFFLFPIIHFFVLLSIRLIYKRVLTLDGKNKQIISSSKNIYGCTCCGQKRIFDFFQIKKVRLYTSSIKDPQRPFHKTYYINCDIFSIDGEQERLFDGIIYDEEKFNELSIKLKKYVNTEVEPLEVQKITQIEENNSTPISN